MRRVRYNPAGSARLPIEITTIDRIRRRGGLAEFAAPQRPDFEMLLAIEHGSTTHEVDFMRYDIAAGDALWVHAGQVQLWGDVRRLEGIAVIFSPDALPADVVALLRTFGAFARNHWADAAASGGPFLSTLNALAAITADSSGPGDPAPRAQARDHAATHAAAAALLLLAGTAESDASTVEVEPPEAFHWLFDEIERSFAEHRTAAWYARRLGYSERTLNRLARTHAGLSAKELIDRRVVLEAKRLLVHEQASVAAIAARLGFDDPANFSKYFKHRAGVAPGAFRDVQR
ncbi:helix-turn-helix transcriptional regulator [Leucobacter iarius]|uniref:Helix-turn-helix domain-containing protein n=1 Tax=Leucobacter iarius TaxID=333963 RepID=A0ABN2LGN6_9MICO